jgi:iron complex transport system substrate-binding protein
MRGGTARALVAGLALAAGTAISWILGGVTATVPLTYDAVPSSPIERDFRYKRIICLSPAITEIVFAIGGGPRVVGVSHHTKFPREALLLPACGTYTNPNYELILKLEPDLLLAEGEAQDTRTFASDYGIELVQLRPWTLESIYEAVRRAGEVLQMGASAELVEMGMRYRLAQVHEAVSGRNPTPVVLVTGRDPGALSHIWAAGPDTFLDDLIAVAGGRNVLGDLRASYAEINKETLIERAPEVVVELVGEGEDEALRRQALRVWQAMPGLPAVQNGRVHVIQADYAMIPGPRVVALAELLAGFLHPEVVPWSNPY